MTNQNVEKSTKRGKQHMINNHKGASSADNLQNQINRTVLSITNVYCKSCSFHQFQPGTQAILFFI